MPGGGDTLNIYWWGCIAAHTKGGLRHGHNPKKGVLGTGTTRKNGILKIKNWSCKKEDLSNLVTDVPEACVKATIFELPAWLTSAHKHRYEDRLHLI